MANIVYIATSLDGYIAKKDGDTNWLHEIPVIEGEDYGFHEFMDRIDALVMGRNTYEKVVGMTEVKGSSNEESVYGKKIFVLSNSLKKIDSSGKEDAEVISGPLQQVVDKLKNKSFSNLYIDGGKTIQSFLKENLIDELIITKIPIILGDGIPLFCSMNLTLKLEHVETKSWTSGLVQSHYKVIK